MSTSKIVTFRAALAAAITAQLTSDGTTGVTVHQYPQVDVGREDVIVFQDADANQTHLAFGGSREETFTLSGEIFAPQNGGSTTEAGEGETRALLIYASIENTLRTDPTVSSTLFHAQIASYTSEVVIDERGYIGHVAFTIDVEAHL